MKSNEKKGILILILVSIVIIAVIYGLTRGSKDNNTNTNILNSKDIQQSVNTIHDPSHNGRKLTNDRSAALCR